MIVVFEKLGHKIKSLNISKISIVYPKLYGNDRE